MQEAIGSSSSSNGVGTVWPPTTSLVLNMETHRRWGEQWNNHYVDATVTSSSGFKRHPKAQADPELHIVSTSHRRPSQRASSSFAAFPTEGRACGRRTRSWRSKAPGHSACVVDQNSASVDLYPERLMASPDAAARGDCHRWAAEAMHNFGLTKSSFPMANIR